jgi:hypothetical protein
VLGADTSKELWIRADGVVSVLPDVLVCVLPDVVVGVLAEVVVGVAAEVVVWVVAAVVAWVAAEVVVWVLGAVVAWVAAEVVVWVLGAAVVCGLSVLGAAVVRGLSVAGAEVSGLCGLRGPLPGPPGQSGPVHGGGSSGTALASPAFGVSAAMATAATPATRFMDILFVSLSGFGPDGFGLPAAARYGQVTSISNDLLTCCGCCGLLMSAPVAVPLIA